MVRIGVLLTLECCAILLQAIGFYNLVTLYLRDITEPRECGRMAVICH